MVGDSWRDMAAAHAFGAEAIGVRNGQSLSAPEASTVAGTRPDVVVADLASAVALLLDEDPALEALADEISSRRAASGDAKLLVLLAGAPQAGKSTTAFRLRRALRARAEDTLWVRLEDWNSPEAAAGAVEALLEGRSIEEPAQYDPTGCSVLLVEGRSALRLEDGGRAIRVYLEAPGEEARPEEDPALAARGEKAQVRLTPRRPYATGRDEQTGDREP